MNQAELKGFSKDNYVRLDEMKERADTLRSAREEKRKNVSLLVTFLDWPHTPVSFKNVTVLSKLSCAFCDLFIEKKIHCQKLGMYMILLLKK